MNYSQYLEEHQQLTKELDGASKEFEDLRSSYDNASPEARSNLEPELKESINRVEAARSHLSSLESQNPQHEADRVSGVVPEQEEAIDRFEIMASVSDLAKKALDFIKVLIVMTTFGGDLPPNVATVEASPTVQTEQKPVEESKDIGEGLEDIETLRGGPKQRKEETAEQVKAFHESSQSYDDTYANARSREDILDKFEQSYRNDVPQLENQQQQEQNQGISY